MVQDLLLTLDNLEENFSPIMLQRGMQYKIQKRITKYDVYPEKGEHKWLVRSKVQGNYLYRQHIEIRRKTHGYSIEADCDCPVGYNCKHSAAVMLQVMETQSAQSPHEDAVHTWLGKLDTIHPVDPGVIPLKREAFLIVRLFVNAYSDFDYYRATYLKNGSISKGRKIDKDSLRHSKIYLDFVTEEDRELILQLSQLNVATTYYNTIEKFVGEYGAIMLRKLARTGKGYYKDHTVPLRYDPQPRALCFVWKQEGESYRLVPNLENTMQLIPTTEPPVGIDLAEDRLIVFESPLKPQELQWILHAPPMSESAAREVTLRVLEMNPEMDFPMPSQLDTKTIIAELVPHLYLDAHERDGRRSHRMTLMFGYDEYRVNALPSQRRHRFVEGEAITTIERDVATETDHVGMLEAYGFSHRGDIGGWVSLADPSMQVAIERWRVFLSEGIAALEEQGWIIEIDPDFNYTFDEADAIVVAADEEESGWFALSFQVRIGTREVPLLPIVHQLLEEYDQIEALPPRLNLEYAPGRFVHIASDEVAPILQTLFELFDRFDGGESLQVNPYDAHLLPLSETTVWKGSDALRVLAEKLKNFQGIEAIEPAETLQATLRPYQRFGLDWLHFLHGFDFGGILADDMGLGKTIQTLAHLQHLKVHDQLEGPSLIIVPTSLLGNWKREIARFTPNLSVLELYGSERHAYLDQMESYDLVLTTYALIVRDAKQYAEHRFDYLILDEAQKIKNPTTKMAQTIKTLSSHHRLALTGTPMENHLGELWSLFDFVMPGFLGGLKTFREAYQKPIEKEHNEPRRQLLSRKTAPFILRRTKEHVATELPPKTEIIRRVRLDARQAKLYENIRVAMEEKVREAIHAKGAARSHIMILDALLKLRQVCNHPKLLKLSAAKKVTESAKTNLFFELLEELMGEGRKVLIFSQFTQMLGLLEEGIRARKYRYTKLTGATRKREEAITRFTDGQADIFLISLKAGGVGLNLVAADTVIHYDPWWNPAVENQATDRAYRIGQDKPVFVYKLIVENTVEEKILQLQEKKKALTEAIYANQTNAEDRLGSEELVALLGL
jgi:superfamily II DNA or RNA helicase